MKKRWLAMMIISLTCYVVCDKLDSKNVTITKQELIECLKEDNEGEI